MATFTEAEIKQIWTLFEFEREELHQRSRLRQCISDTERDDVTYSTDIVSDIKYLLTEITTLETEDIPSAAADSHIEVVVIDNAYRVETDPKSDPATYPRQQRSLKKERIRTLLRLDAYGFSGRSQHARVNGISSGSYAYRRTY